jgi:hypothetical protein
MNAALKIYLAYFIIKNTLKILLLYYLKKRGVTIKHVILIIKNKRRNKK